MENDSPSCQMTNHQNSNEHRNTQELWKPKNPEAGTKTKFYIFEAPPEEKKPKNWWALCSMLASRKFLGSPRRLFNFQHRIKPMHKENFETKDKLRFVASKMLKVCDLFFDCWWWKKDQHPAVSFHQKQLINRPASFAAQDENMKTSDIMSRYAKYKVFHD